MNDDAEDDAMSMVQPHGTGHQSKCIFHKNNFSKSINSRLI